MILQRRMRLISFKKKIFLSLFVSRQSSVSSAINKLTELLGKENVATALSVREHHGHDESYRSASPSDAVIFPSCTDQVRKSVQICNESNVPMIAFGTGTGLEGGSRGMTGGISFSLAKMDQVIEVNEEDFDCTVQPGVTRKSLNSYLRDTGLWFPVDPGADASLCGMAATSASGTNAVKYGTMKDNVINLEVVLADGSVLHTAGKGRRPRKTAAGYNLTNLFVGSEGTLGIITKATLRLYGIPEATLVAVCPFHSVQAAVDTTVMILQTGIPVARVEFLDDLQMRACNKFSGLDYEETPTLFFEFHGPEFGLKEQANSVADIASMNGGKSFHWATDVDERNKLWQARHDAWYAAQALKPGCKGISTDVCVPLSRLTEMILETKNDIKESGLMGTIVGHVGDGNFHTMIFIDPNDPTQTLALASKIADRALAMDGTCTGEHGIGLGKRALLEKELGPVGIQTMRRIKQSLDPKNLMNPDKKLFSAN